MKKYFKAISKKMVKERKICIKNMQNTKAGENPILLYLMQVIGCKKLMLELY